jgi:hypothetical protein
MIEHNLTSCRSVWARGSSGLPFEARRPLTGKTLISVDAVFFRSALSARNPSVTARGSYISCQAAKSRQSYCMGLAHVASGRGLAPKGSMMNLEKYTERARGFVQSAQSLTLREGISSLRPSTCSRCFWTTRKGSPPD